MSRVRRRTGWRPFRTLRLLDAENLAGSGRPSAAALAAVATELAVAVGTGLHDHTVVAAGPAAAVGAGLAWPGAQLLVGRGADGADLALLEWAAQAALTERFDGVVVGSGDFAFASLVAQLLEAGLPVTIVARAGSCSQVLRALCDDVRLLGSPTLDLRQGGGRSRPSPPDLSAEQPTRLARCVAGSTMQPHPLT